MSIDLSNLDLIAKFGKWLKEQRLGQGLSLREASGRSGISSQRLLSVESGALQVGLNSVETSMMCRTYRITASEFLLKASGQFD